MGKSPRDLPSHGIVKISIVEPKNAKNFPMGAHRDRSGGAAPAREQ